ncbi:MAG TPA: NAD(P)-binding protein [Stellaceae bacterium]|nr:NAD(P)-binding protein [Stellaceae bacterium]
MTRGFDAIVVGSGLGGLTAGALYAQAGRRVLVLERNDSFGGAATVYRHNGLAIEASLHEIDGLDAGDPKLPLLHALGLDPEADFVQVGDLHEMRGGLIGAPFALPHGIDSARAATTRRFPHQAAGLKIYFQWLTAIRGAVGFAAEHQDDRTWWLRHGPQTVHHIWPLVRHGRASVSEALRHLFGEDEAVKAALAGNLAYYHDDPGRMRFLHYAIPQASFLLGGGHYVRGGSQALTDRLVSLIRAAGGVAESGREVGALVMDRHRITGVGHRARGGGDARVDTAPVAFGNAAPQRLAEMLPQEWREIFLAPYQRRRLSISLWTLSLGLSRPAGEFGVTHYSTCIFPDWMRSIDAYREASAILAEDPGDRLPPYVFVDYRRIATGLNEAGPFLGSFCGVDRVENWADLPADRKRERRERWMDRLIGDLDRHFPGIAGAVVHREMATAETMEQYLNTPRGAVYGYAPDENLGETLARSPATAIHGLWLASAFTMSGGYTGAMLGGAAAARAALRANP